MRLEVVVIPVADVDRAKGFYKTLGTTARNYGAEDNFGGRLSALWTPSSAFKWKLTLEGFDNQGTPSNMLLQIGPNGKPIDGVPSLQMLTDLVEAALGPRQAAR